MNRPTGELIRGGGLALATYATVMAALLSWSSFTDDAGAYFTPVALIGLIVVAAGILGRALHLPRLLVAAIQLLIGLLVADLWVFGMLAPVTPGQRTHVSDLLNSAYDVAYRFVLPLQVGDGGILPYLVYGGILAVLLGDAIACALRRPPLAGLVLLAVFSVPFSLVSGGVAWWVFALTAAGFLALVGLHESDRIARWGRRLDDGAVAGIAADVRSANDPHARGIVDVGPGAIGVAATAIALVVPLFVPTLHLDLSGLGPGGNGSGPIHVSNPTVGMYDDLRRRSDTPLLTLRRTAGGDGTDPSYLRIATLNSFNGEEWSPGDRQIPSTHAAHATFSPPMSNPKLLGTPTTYRFTATSNFDSTWLPTFVYTTRIDASGEWRYDDETLDFIAASHGLTTAGRSWTATSAPVDPSAASLLAAPSGSGGVPAIYTELPDMPAKIADIAREKTAAEDTPFAKAVALQEWFHSSGEFSYSLDRPGGTGSQDLLHFVTDQKIGYCQQFATAMAAMARSLGIPARVAVGFLHGEKDGSDWVFRARDMHAWPELWFANIGWVRFEPTPPDASTTVPSYTLGVLGAKSTGGDDDPGSSSTGAPEKLPTKGADPAEQTPKSTDTTADSAADAPDHTTAVVVASTLGGLALVIAALTMPALVRRRRRARRLLGGPEEAWQEIRDTARDLRLAWSDDLSPRESGLRLTRSLSTPEAQDALARVVVAVERSRYARTPSTEPVDEDAQQVVTALLGAVDPGVRRRAALWPRSMLARRPPASLDRPEQVERQLVDHMG